MGNQPADLTENRFKIDLSPNPVEVRPWFDRVAVDLHDNHATGRPAALPERPYSRTTLGFGAYRFRAGGAQPTRVCADAN
mgnify:FL=1